MSEEGGLEDQALPALAAVLGQLMRIGPAIDQALSTRNDNTADDIYDLERIRTAITFVGKRLDGAENALLVSGPLEEMSRQFSAVVERVEAFTADGDPVCLSEANARLDDALLALTRLNFPRDLEDFQGLREASSKYRKSLVDRTRAYLKGQEQAQAVVLALHKQSEQLREKIESNEAQLQEGIVALKADLAEAQTTHESRLTDVEKSLDATLEELKGRLAEQLDAFRKEQERLHRDAVETHDNELERMLKESELAYEKKLNAWTEAIEKTSAQSATTLQELTANFEGESKELLEKMQANLKQADGLVGLIADRAVTSGHKQAADEARKQVKFWQTVAVLAMIGLVVFALTGVVWPPVLAGHRETPAQTGTEASKGNPTDTSPKVGSGEDMAFNWSKLANRVFVSVTIGVLAAYAASQVNRYQKVERRNRKLELELTALEPFLEPVSADKKEVFRLKMAEAFFGREEESHGDPSPANLAELLKSKEAKEFLKEAFMSLIRRDRP